MHERRLQQRRDHNESGDHRIIFRASSCKLHHHIDSCRRVRAHARRPKPERYARKRTGLPSSALVCSSTAVLPKSSGAAHRIECETTRAVRPRHRVRTPQIACPATRRKPGRSRASHIGPITSSAIRASARDGARVLAGIARRKEPAGAPTRASPLAHPPSQPGSTNLGLLAGAIARRRSVSAAAAG
ncbi:hypothetical protein [Burkholderia oklahomensis]|uniref:hypothetical protein n=1 Tax=Burkholderia oklahomensis TaxID=342113 RepID=UPI0013923B97|nr:hypothetical protein [Burkholderia oklahomensis]QPS41860.1 hypothetical protein I6G57_25785 [Burkholderia oklahomensis]